MAERSMKPLKKIIFCVAVISLFFTFSISEAKVVDKKNFYRSLSSRLSRNREDYSHLTDYEFANFRMVTTTGIEPGKLYRSSSPVKPLIKRNTIADNASRKAQVRTFINLSDKYSSLQGYKGFSESYYSTQKIICLKLNTKYRSKIFQAGVARAVNFMANNEPPYLVHCDVGKDRSGIFCAIIESLMGASWDEIERDYMISFYNYFGISPGSDEYEFVADNEIRALLPAILGVKDIRNVNLYAAARRYLLRIGVRIEDINLLEQKLNNNRKKFLFMR